MSFIKKWYTYQKERFPVLVYGIYVLAIVFATFIFSSLIAKGEYYSKIENNPLSYLMGAPLPYQMQWIKIIPMFIVAFLQFLMVRIIDEFKDFEEDSKYRPYRPVPRGLITLKELKVLFIICVITQLAVTLLINPKSIIWLIVVWIFFAIMSKSFFMKKFLGKHILIEVLLDELLMPVLVTYLASFIYDGNILNLWPILCMSYIVSWIVEVARKIRCQQDEEKGVKTYTAVLGIKKAMLLLSILETILMIIQMSILGKKHMLLVLGEYVVVILTNLIFAIKKSKSFAKLTELSANIYILICYISIGLLIF